MVEIDRSGAQKAALFQRFVNDAALHKVQRQEREGENPRSLRAVFAYALGDTKFPNIHFPTFVAESQDRALRVATDMGLSEPGQFTTFAEAVDVLGPKILTITNHEAIKDSVPDLLFVHTTVAALTKPEDYSGGPVAKRRRESTSQRLFRHVIRDLRTGEGEEAQVKKRALEREVAEQNERTRQLTMTFVLDQTETAGIELFKTEQKAEYKERELTSFKDILVTTKRALRAIEQFGGTEEEVRAELTEAARMHRETEPRGYNSVKEFFGMVLRETPSSPQTNLTEYLNTHHETMLQTLEDFGVGTYDSVVEAVDAGGINQLIDTAVEVSYEIDSERRVINYDLGLYGAMIQTLTSLPSEGYLGGSGTRGKKSQSNFALGIEGLKEFAGELVPQSSIDRGRDLVEKHTWLLTAGQLDDELRPQMERNLRQNLEVLQANEQLHGCIGIARRFLDNLRYVNFSADQARAELNDMFQQYRDHKQALEDWVPLVRGTTDRRASGGGGGAHLASGRTRSSVEWPERLAALHEIVADWGAGEVKESTFHGKGGSKYYAAILPQTRPDGELVRLPDGTPIVHAIFDSPDGAIYEFRGESGYKEDGTSVTYVDVFNHRTKPEALADGAKKYTHHGDWRSRRMEYLTRPVEDLDK